jgi:hypothetical protein
MLRYFRLLVSELISYTMLNSCTGRRHDAVAGCVCGGGEGRLIEGAETSIMHPNHHPLRRISKGFKKVHYAFLVAKTLMDFEHGALRAVVTQPAVCSANLSGLYNLCGSVGT